MKKAGIDFGLTHVKAFWINSKKDEKEEEMFLSTADVSRNSLASVLAHSGVTDLCVNGNGQTHGFEDFRHHRLEKPRLSLLEAEIHIQAAGARRLLQQQLLFPEMYYLISIGTGTSYTLCNQRLYASLLGSAIGAGTVDGLLALAGVASGPHIDALLGDKLVKGDFSSFDLMLVEAIPSLKGTLHEQHAASHLAKVPQELSRLGVKNIAERVCMSAVNMLVTDVACRILLHDKNPQCRYFLDPVWLSITDVVILGTMPHLSKNVRLILEVALRSIGKNPIFPDHGEYALAVGAYHSIDLQ